MCFTVPETPLQAQELRLDSLLPRPQKPMSCSNTLDRKRRGGEKLQLFDRSCRVLKPMHKTKIGVRQYSIPQQGAADCLRTRKTVVLSVVPRELTSIEEAREKQALGASVPKLGGALERTQQEVGPPAKPNHRFNVFHPL